MITNLRALDCRKNFLCQNLKKLKKQSAGNMFTYVRMKGLILLFHHFLVSIAVEVSLKSHKHVIAEKSPSHMYIPSKRCRGLEFVRSLR